MNKQQNVIRRKTIRPTNNKAKMGKFVQQQKKDRMTKTKKEQMNECLFDFEKYFTRAL